MFSIVIVGESHVLLTGPPRYGKSMISGRIPSILPEMTRAEALETTKVYSALGLAQGLIEHPTVLRPAPALISGGSFPRHGEISLAHNGVLFFDELPEFPSAAVEASASRSRSAQSPSIASTVH